jgi:uncharacterized membrane protein YjfL (UPF0719 family)
MKKTSLLAVSFWMATLCPLFAADTSAVAAPSWHAQTLLAAIGNVLIFAGIGIAVAILGFKVFDWCTPGDLQREIIENKNVAAAIVAAAAILGVSVIIAASIMG